MNKKTFVKNTAVMTVTSLLLRTLGIVFRVFISGRVGAEGMGLYQLVFSVYVLGTTFAAAGIVTAVTRMVAEQIARGTPVNVSRVMRLSMGLCVLIGTASAAILFFGAPTIGGWVGDARTVPALAVSGLALPFIGVASCVKGYFMARRRAMRSASAASYGCYTPQGIAHSRRPAASSSWATRSLKRRRACSC